MSWKSVNSFRLFGIFANRERQRPRWLRSACLRAEEDLGFPEKAVQSEGLSLSTNSTNFHELGAASPGNFLSGLIRVHSVNSWLKNVQRHWLCSACLRAEEDLGFPEKARLFRAGAHASGGHEYGRENRLEGFPFSFRLLT
jgi:hypothetical protein